MRTVKDSTWPYFLSHASAVFSPAYLRNSGPLPLQCWFNFDVVLGWSQWLWCGHKLHPKYALPIHLQFGLGRTLLSIIICGPYGVYLSPAAYCAIMNVMLGPTQSCYVVCFHFTLFARPWRTRLITRRDQLLPLKMMIPASVSASPPLSPWRRTLMKKLLPLTEKLLPSQLSLRRTKKVKRKVTKFHIHDIVVVISTKLSFSPVQCCFCNSDIHCDLVTRVYWRLYHKILCLN